MSAWKEIAWDGRGKWAGEGPRPHTARPPLEVPHQCARRGCGTTLQERHRDPDCGVFVCATCKRVVPWCFGCDLGDYELSGSVCDDCWAYAEAAIEQKERRQRLRDSAASAALPLLALCLLVLTGCAPQPAIVRCRNTGTRFDAPGGVKIWVSVNYSIEHAAFQVFPDRESYDGSMTLPTGFCDVEWVR